MSTDIEKAKAFDGDVVNEAKPRAWIGNVPVFCAFDKLENIDSLVFHPRNPNKHPDDQIKLLAHIIENQGWRAPVTVSKRSGYIIRGHGRVMAAVESGQPMVPVDYQEYASEEAEMADLIADNRLSELSVIDNPTLKDLLADLDTGDFDMLLTGFEIDDIEELITENADIPVEPEVKFTEVLREEHNYVVLYFDNEIDWLQAESLLGIDTVKALSTRTDGEIPKSQVKKGIGRVLKGSVALERLRNEYQR